MELKLGDILEAQNNESQILFLAINEREKSLKFYESLCDFKSANLQDLDESLHEILIQIAIKEREILTDAKAIFEKNNANLDESNETILLPSALPNDILQELLNEMETLKHLNILALGIESHHLKTCDFLIKNAKDAQIIDMLYQIQALSYNHHIPLLQGELPKENANPKNLNGINFANSQHTTNPQANLLLAFLQILQGTNSNINQSVNLSTINSLSDLLKQSPLLNEIKTSLDALQNIYNQTKDIVKKLEHGELQQDELVGFLQKLRF